MSFDFSSINPLKNSTSAFNFLQASPLSTAIRAASEPAQSASDPFSLLAAATGSSATSSTTKLYSQMLQTIVTLVQPLVQAVVTLSQTVMALAGVKSPAALAESAGGSSATSTAESTKKTDEGGIWDTIVDFGSSIFETVTKNMDLSKIFKKITKLPIVKTITEFGGGLLSKAAGWIGALF